jgi:5'-methylthioadenosine phosphorylase
VGMTLVPECFLARELEICYAMVCYVTNYAEGVGNREYQAGELFEGLLNAVEKLKVDAAVKDAAGCAIKALGSIGDTPRRCGCGKSMERYRSSGRIGSDWHTWIESAKLEE